MHNAMVRSLNPPVEKTVSRSASNGNGLRDFNPYMPRIRGIVLGYRGGIGLCMNNGIRVFGIIVLGFRLI
jgi:hypothetical protein